MEKLSIKIKGKVIHGKGLGKIVGMPTANLDFDITNTKIDIGVYASVVYLEKEYVGVTNIGTRPSVDNDKKISIETHILDFDRDIYGEIIEIELIEKIRDIKKFNNLEEVKMQVDKDKLVAKKIYKEINTEV